MSKILKSNKLFGFIGLKDKTGYKTFSGKNRMMYVYDEYCRGVDLFEEPTIIYLYKKRPSRTSYIFFN